MDLKVAYFHFPMLTSSRKLWGFMAGGGLPVPSPGIRSVDCSPSLPSGFHSLVRVVPRLRDSSSEVAGRLTASRFSEAGSQTIGPVPPLSLSLP